MIIFASFEVLAGNPPTELNVTNASEIGIEITLWDGLDERSIKERKKQLYCTNVTFLLPKMEHPRITTRVNVFEGERLKAYIPVAKS